MFNIADPFSLFYNKNTYLVHKDFGKLIHLKNTIKRVHSIVFQRQTASSNNIVLKITENI